VVKVLQLNVVVVDVLNDRENRQHGGSDQLRRKLRPGIDPLGSNSGRRRCAQANRRPSHQGQQ
jgi:hypothetical protein